MGGKEADGTALPITTQQNAVKKKFDKKIAIPLDFDFFSHMALKNAWLLGLNSILQKRQFYALGTLMNARYKLSDISLEYDAILDESYATAMGGMYWKVDSIHQGRIDPLPDTV